MISALLRSRATRASCSSAFRVSGTTTRFCPPWAECQASDTRAAAAPPARAASTKSWPSCVSPLMAMNRALKPISRESMEIDAMGPSSSPSARPPVAAMISATVHRGDKSEAFQGLRDHFMVGEVVLGGADDLIILVPLARNEQHVALGQLHDRTLDRLAAVGDLPRLGGLLKDLGADRGRIFGARVVVRYRDAVG